MEVIKAFDERDDPELLPVRLRRHASEQPDKLCVVFLDDDLNPQESWSFAELDRRGRSIAVHLQDLGLEGQPIAVAYTSVTDFAEAFMGCLYAGAVAVPASMPRSHGVDERMNAILDDCMARYVLTSSRHEAQIAAHLSKGSNGGTTASLLATDTLMDRSAEWKTRVWQPDQLAVLQYTSGSTRLPRGVMVSQGNLAANLRSLYELGSISKASVGVGWLPLFHDMGLIGGLLEPVWAGYPAYLMAPATFLQRPMRWLTAITRYRGTHSGGPNFGYQACIDAATPEELDTLDLSSWEVAVNGAEPVRAGTVDGFISTFGPAGFRASTMLPGFGLAEATLVVTGGDGSHKPLSLHVDEQELRNGAIREVGETSPNAKKLIGSGHPCSRTLIRIVNPDTLREAAPYEVGEIWVQSQSVGQGYWQKPDETAYTFQAHLHNGEGPFLRTGDLGFMHGGELFVTGRLKDIIVIRGANYYPQDIEQTVVASHPALRQDASAVVGVEDATGVRLVAVQELDRHSWRRVDPDEVFDAMRRAVAREHQLALDGIVLLKPFSLPKTTSGKVQRAECRIALSEERLSGLYEWWAPAERVAPIDFTGEPLDQPGVLERQLVDWLKRELALTELTWHTPLMELGIDSLKGVELGTALSAAFNHSFSATLLIDYPTIAALAGFIREEVLGAKPEHSPPPAAQKASLADDIMAMDDEQLDAMLQKSIEDVLKGGGSG